MINWSFIDAYTGGLNGKSIIDDGFFWIDEEINLLYYPKKGRQLHLGHFTEVEYAFKAAEKYLLSLHLELTDHDLKD